MENIIYIWDTESDTIEQKIEMPGESDDYFDDDF